MANKETKELGVLIAKVIDAVAASLEDKKIDLKDLANFLEPVFAAQPATEGIGLVGGENANSSIPEREDTKKAVATELTKLDESTKYDLTEAFGGILAIYRFGYRLGQKAGEEGILDDIRHGKLSISELLPDKE